MVENFARFWFSTRPEGHFKPLVNTFNGVFNISERTYLNYIGYIHEYTRHGQCRNNKAARRCKTSRAQFSVKRWKWGLEFAIIDAYWDNLDL